PRARAADTNSSVDRRGTADALIAIKVFRIEQRSSALTLRSARLPRAIDAVVGGMLELAIHTIEGLRDRIAMIALLCAPKRSIRTTCPSRRSSSRSAQPAAASASGGHLGLVGLVDR